MNGSVRCRECKYWLESHKYTRTNKKRGECRKSEPSLGSDGYGYWPLTAYDEFCFAGTQKQREVLNEQSGILAE